MKFEGSHWILSATDLSLFSSCKKATLLDREAALGRATKPYRDDPALQLLEERGRQHETRYLEFLEQECHAVAERVVVAPPKSRDDWNHGVDRTLSAMRQGRRILYQAPLLRGAGAISWSGLADFLVRVDHGLNEPDSALGAYHYEVTDTKLATETRAASVLQLCVYTTLLTDIQRFEPAGMTLAKPARRQAGGAFVIERLKTVHYTSYFSRIRRRMSEFLNADVGAVYPEPCDHCDICRWWSDCDRRRRGDDHLSLVAGVTRGQRHELGELGVMTLDALARLEVAAVPKRRRLPLETLERLHHQARLQNEAKALEPKVELLEPEPGRGFARLPVPSPGDVFFDIEADRYDTSGTFHYLLGWVESSTGTPHRRSLWADTSAEEKANFEQFVDRVRGLRAEFPLMHIYHFAPFERIALGELAGRHSTRVEEVDDLLREQVLVDLLPVVRQGLRAGIESYSLKEIERFHGFSRRTELRQAAIARRWYELGRLHLNSMELTPLRETIQDYNAEDCESTLSLRSWLETMRENLIIDGKPVARPSTEVPAQQEQDRKLDDWAKRVEHLTRRLLDGVPEEGRTPEQEARLLMANLLDYHRRKEKPIWWEYFRLRERTPDELLDEPVPIAGIGPATAAGTDKRSLLFNYGFPPQEFKLKLGEKVECPVTKQQLGTIHGLDRAHGVITLKRTAEVHSKVTDPPQAIAPSVSPPPLELLQQALADLGQYFSVEVGRTDTGFDGMASPRFGAAETLLRRSCPRLRSEVPLRLDTEDDADAAVRIAPYLDETVLAIQGPPGSGKSYTGARMILALIRQGKRVGITGPSHKVISNLIDKTHGAADREGFFLESYQKGDKEDISAHQRNNRLSGKACPGDKNLLGGTAWFWVSDAARAAPVDVLFIDEAGQFSLADALAVSTAANSLVLLGDPQQLANPDPGTHPPGAGVSALEHLLDGAETIDADKGLFLARTWRLPPQVTRFTSRYFYGGRLDASPGCAGRRLDARGPASRYSGAGLFFEPIEHAGNVSRCEPEAELIADRIRDLLAGNSSWVDDNGDRHGLSEQQILVVAPYNDQVLCISEVLAKSGFLNVAIGTVDKFQGQEAPVVFYSLTTSNAADAPRGLDFLFSPNRLNVATSRTQAIVVIVGSPALLEAECKTPHQMRLVNALCGAVDLAEPGPPHE